MAHGTCLGLALSVVCASSCTPLPTHATTSLSYQDTDPHRVVIAETELAEAYGVAPATLTHEATVQHLDAANICFDVTLRMDNLHGPLAAPSAWHVTLTASNHFESRDATVGPPYQRDEREVRGSVERPSRPRGECTAATSALQCQQRGTGLPERDVFVLHVIRTQSLVCFPHHGHIGPATESMRLAFTDPSSDRAFGFEWGFLPVRDSTVVLPALRVPPSP